MPIQKIECILLLLFVIVVPSERTRCYKFLSAVFCISPFHWTPNYLTWHTRNAFHLWYWCGKYRWIMDDSTRYHRIQHFYCHCLFSRCSIMSNIWMISFLDSNCDKQKTFNIFGNFSECVGIFSDCVRISRNVFELNIRYRDVQNVKWSDWAFKNVAFD